MQLLLIASKPLLQENLGCRAIASTLDICCGCSILRHMTLMIRKKKMVIIVMLLLFVF